VKNQNCDVTKSPIKKHVKYYAAMPNGLINDIKLNEHKIKTSTACFTLMGSSGGNSGSSGGNCTRNKTWIMTNYKHM